MFWVEWLRKAGEAEEQKKRREFSLDCSGFFRSSFFFYLHFLNTPFASTTSVSSIQLLNNFQKHILLNTFIIHVLCVWECVLQIIIFRLLLLVVVSVVVVVVVCINVHAYLFVMIFVNFALVSFCISIEMWYIIFIASDSLSLHSWSCSKHVEYFQVAVVVVVIIYAFNSLDKWSFLFSLSLFFRISLIYIDSIYQNT